MQTCFENVLSACDISTVINFKNKLGFTNLCYVSHNIQSHRNNSVVHNRKHT